MDDYAAYSSGIGAEPMLQLPLVSGSNTAARVARAENLLGYYVGTKGYPLSWVDIGNEPKELSFDQNSRSRPCPRFS